jgi:predicted metal-dependent phosphoesterase TrpH
MIDLHVHTNISDGSFTIGEIIWLARKKGITHLAVTDHDTTKGLPEAMELGERMGVKIIPGIEISAYDHKRKKRVHILGLNVEDGHPALDSLCAPLAENRNEASRAMVSRLVAAGYDLSWQEVEKYAGGTGVYKQHIMHALLDKGYCRSIYGDLYQKLFNRGNEKEAPGIAFMPLTYVDVLKAISAVKVAGGIPVLAHPGYYANFEGVAEWIEYGLAGIEAFHPSHSEKDCRLALRYADTYGLLVSGGSDFHGFYDEIPVELGCRELSENLIALLRSKKNGAWHEQPGKS